MPPTAVPHRRRVKYKQRTPRSVRGGSRRATRTLVAALLAVGFGAPAALFLRAVVREGQADPARIARRFQVGAPTDDEALLRLPAASPVRTAMNNQPRAAAVGWSTPAPETATPGTARAWEAPFAGGSRTVVAANVPVAPAPVLAARGPAATVAAPAPFAAPIRGASAIPVSPRSFGAPTLASLATVNGAIATAASGTAIESAPTAALLAPTTGAAVVPGPRTRVAAAAQPAAGPLPFVWSGAAIAEPSLGSNSNWTNNFNWAGNAAPGPTASENIVYAAVPVAATATTVNTNYTINSLTFQAAAPSYNVTNSNGSDLFVGAGGITNASANAQTLSLPVYAIANHTITVSNAAGVLNMPGAAEPSQSPVALYLQGQNRTVTFDGAGTTNISGQVREGNSVVNGALVKNGAGTLILAGDNSYTGGTTLNAGVIDAQSGTALGSGTFTINGGGVTTNTGVFLANSVTVNGNFAHAPGDYALAFSGPVSLGAASRTITATGATERLLYFDGVISATAASVGLTLTGDTPGTLGQFAFDGANANTYTGATLVDNARLILNKDSVVAVPGNLTVQNGGNVTTFGNQLAATTNLTVNTNATFNASQGSETINRLDSTGGDATGTVSIGNQFYSTQLTVKGGNFAGLIQDGFINDEEVSSTRAAATSPFGSTGGQLNKVSTDTLVLSHNNTYSSGTLVSAGALFANNTPTRATDSATGRGDVLVLDGARLGGSGSVGYPAATGEGSPSPASTVTIGGTLAAPSVGGRNAVGPGPNVAVLGAGATLNSTAILTVNGNLTLTSTALLEVEVAGTTAGTGYDQVRVGGAIALGGDLSLATINGFALTVGQTFYVLDGIGVDAVTGVFANVTPQTVTTGLFTDANGDLIRVNYADSDPNDPSQTTGNDVSLTVLAVPEPGSLALAALG